MGLAILVMSTIPLLFFRIESSSAQTGAVLVVIVLLLSIYAVFILDFIAKKLKKWKVVRGLSSLAVESRNVLLSISSGPILIILSIIVHLLSIIAVIVLAEGLGLEIEWLGILLVVPLVTLFMTIPIWNEL